jgi:hypothetical protein
MFNQLLPQRIDNTYHGHKLALWVFGVVVFVKIAQCVVVIFNGYSIVVSADGVPLDTFSAAAAQTVVALFANSAVHRLFIFMLCVLVLVRYRSAIPFMFGLLALDYLGAQLIDRFVTIVRTGTPPATIVNPILFVLMIVGLALSLWNQSARTSAMAVEGG